MSYLLKPDSSSSGADSSTSSSSSRDVDDNNQENVTAGEDAAAMVNATNNNNDNNNRNGDDDSLNYNNSTRIGEETRRRPRKQRKEVESESFIQVLAEQNDQMKAFMREFVSKFEPPATNEQHASNGKANEFTLSDFAERIWPLFATRTSTATPDDFISMLSAAVTMSSALEVGFRNLFVALKAVSVHQSFFDTESEGSLILEQDVKLREVRNYICRFELLATFSELVYDRLSKKLVGNQLPANAELRDVSKLPHDFLLESDFAEARNNMPSTPNPFPGSPLLLLLSHKYPTRESVPRFVDEFVNSALNSNQLQQDDSRAVPFDEYLYFSRRVSALLLRLSPNPHVSSTEKTNILQENFGNWFYCAASAEWVLFHRFITDHFEKMLHRLGLDFTAPIPAASFSDLVNADELAQRNKEITDILHQGGELRGLQLACEEHSRDYFLGRWQETSGSARIDIVSATKSLSDRALIDAFSQNNRLVILSGPSGCGKSVAAFTLAQTGVVAYIYAKQITREMDFAKPPGGSNVTTPHNNDVYVATRDAKALSTLAEALWKCLHPGLHPPWRMLQEFRQLASSTELQKTAVAELLKKMFGDWSRSQRTNSNLTLAVDEVGDHPVWVRACTSVVKLFCDCVKQFFKIDGSVRLVVIGTGAENFELNDKIGSTRQSYTVIPIKPKNLLFHLLSHKASAGTSSEKPIFSALLNFLFPHHNKKSKRNEKNAVASASPVASDSVSYRVLQLASNARCAVLLIKFFQIFASARGNTNNNNNNNNNNSNTSTYQESEILWRLRAGLPLILQQVATAFGSLNGLALVQGDLAKNREIATALGYSLNRRRNLTIHEWSRSATMFGLTTDTARWLSQSCADGQIFVCGNDGNPLTNSDGDVYCSPADLPRFQIAEASIAFLMQRLGIIDSEKGFAANGGWELLEQLTFDFHCIRSIIPSTPEIDQQFDTLFSAQQFATTRDFPLTSMQQKETNEKTRSAVVSRPIWADPHVLFSVRSNASSPRIKGIYPIHLKTALEKSNVDFFEEMALDKTLFSSQRMTWRRAVKKNFAVVLMNAPRAASADVICLTPGRVFLSQCKHLTVSSMSPAKILEEFRKMRESEVVSLLRRCCMDDRSEEGDVQVVCTLVLSREDSVNLWKRRDDGNNDLGLWYETDDLNNKNIREFFVAENRGSTSEFISSFYPFMQSRTAVIETVSAKDPSVRVEKLRALWD